MPLLTVGELAREIGAQLHQVEYILKTRKDIEPTGYIGGKRVFNRDTVARIRREIESRGR